MYPYLLKHPQLFPAVIGVTKDQFDHIVGRVHPVLFRFWKTRQILPGRIRASGGGRKRLFDTDAKLVFFILFYYKVYPTFRLAQVIFQLDKTNIFRWVEFMKPVLLDALGTELSLPTQKTSHMGQLLTVCPKLQEFIVDATERRIQRPKDTDAQEFYYSGKKKYHTVKNQVITDPRTTHILAVSVTVEGKRHDKKLAEDDTALLHAPPGSIGMGDSGYQGAEGINPLCRFVYPKKKPRKRELTLEEKDTNRIISQIRVRVEHPFAYMKHFNILSHTFRNSINKADLPFKTIACIYNVTR